MHDKPRGEGSPFVRTGATLFGSLAKWRTVPENFATVSLGWLVGNDTEFRAAFFDACGHVCNRSHHRNRRRGLLRLIDKLRNDSSLNTIAHEGIFIRTGARERCFYPDLRLIGSTTRVCGIVEVKLDARPTVHPADSPTGEGASHDVVQTAAYRRWLRMEHPRRGLLLTLTRARPASELSRHCDLAMTWRDLASQLDLRGNRLSPAGRDFRTYLEETKMATIEPRSVSLTPEDATALRSARRVGWDKWKVLLDATARELAQAIAAALPRMTPRVHRLPADLDDLGISAVDETVWIWTTWVIARAKARFDIAPCIVCGPAKLGVAMNVWSPRLGRVDLDDLMRLVPRARVDPDSTGTMTFHLPPLPPSFFAERAIEKQARLIASSTLRTVIRPLAPIL